jgi:hypothetical protein
MMKATICANMVKLILTDHLYDFNVRLGNAAYRAKIM